MFLLRSRMKRRERKQNKIRPPPLSEKRPSVICSSDDFTHHSFVIHVLGFNCPRAVWQERRLLREVLVIYPLPSAALKCIR